jgi:hypothetical protein
MNDITVKAVDLIFDRHNIFEIDGSFTPIEYKKIDEAISLIDQSLINALEWLSFQKSQLPKLIEYTNTLSRYFLIHDRLNSLDKLFKQYPIEQISFDDIPTHLLQERTQYMAILNCFSKYNSWNLCLLQQSRNKTDIDSLNWKNKIQQETITCSSAILELLSQPILEFTNFHTQDATKTAYKRIKKLYIPQLVLNCFNMFYQTHVLIPGNLEKCLDLIVLTCKPGQICGLDYWFLASGRINEFLNAVEFCCTDILDRPLPWI